MNLMNKFSDLEATRADMSISSIVLIEVQEFHFSLIPIINKNSILTWMVLNEVRVEYEKISRGG